METVFQAVIIIFMHGAFLCFKEFCLCDDHILREGSFLDERPLPL